MIALLSIPTAYLLGSIPFSWIVARCYGIPDIRQVGSGNPGATNVWRTAGPVAGLLAFAGDIAKGVAAILVGRAMITRFGSAGLTSDALLVLTGLAAVLGHIFTVFLSFRGGKGVAAGLGVMVTLLPIPTLIALAGFGVVAGLTRIVSLGSMLAGLVLAATVLVQRFMLGHDVALVYVWMTAILAVLVLWTHRQNIMRLVQGRENRFDAGGRQNEIR